MAKQPKFSIITVCLNAQNLRQTCDSIVGQTCQDFQWLVIDGGSNKKTLDIFEKYRDRIDFWVSEKDSGIYNAMNKGIANATGEYLLFLNAGDFFHSKYVLERFMESGLDADVIYANLQFDATGAVWVLPKVLDIKFWVKQTLPHPATLIKADLFKRYGTYNENYKIASDYEKFVEFIYVHHCTYKHVDFIASVFDCTGISSTSDCSAERMDIIKKYLCRDEINHFAHNKLSGIQKIFSVMPWLVDKTYLDITVFGKHFYIKRKKSESNA